MVERIHVGRTIRLLESLVEKLGNIHGLLIRAEQF
jgi:hypothetical protein